MELPIRWYFLNPDTDPNNPPKGPRGECIFGWASGYLVGDRTSEQTHEHMLPGFRGGASTNTHSGFPIPLQLHLVLEDEYKGGDDDGNNNGHDNRHDYDVGTKTRTTTAAMVTTTATTTASTTKMTMTAKTLDESGGNRADNNEEANDDNYGDEVRTQPK